MRRINVHHTSMNVYEFHSIPLQVWWKVMEENRKQNERKLVASRSLLCSSLLRDRKLYCLTGKKYESSFHAGFLRVDALPLINACASIYFRCGIHSKTHILTKNASNSSPPVSSKASPYPPQRAGSTLRTQYFILCPLINSTRLDGSD